MARTDEVRQAIFAWLPVNGFQVASDETVGFPDGAQIRYDQVAVNLPTDQVQAIVAHLQATFRDIRPNDITENAIRGLAQDWATENTPAEVRLADEQGRLRDAHAGTRRRTNWTLGAVIATAAIALAALFLPRIAPMKGEVADLATKAEQAVKTAESAKSAASEARDAAKASANEAKAAVSSASEAVTAGERAAVAAEQAASAAKVARDEARRSAIATKGSAETAQAARRDIVTIVTTLNADVKSAKATADSLTKRVAGLESRVGRVEEEVVSLAEVLADEVGRGGFLFWQGKAPKALVARADSLVEAYARAYAETYFESANKDTTAAE